MANLLQAQEWEVCYLSVEDVRDSLWEPISLLSDTEIDTLIVKAQAQINTYLNTINPDIPCDGFDCEDIPLDIQRATLQIIDNIYTDETAVSSGSVGYEQGRRIKREKTACWVEVEYEYDDDNIASSGCLMIDCKTQDLLSCYEKRVWNMSLCASSCPCGFKNSFYCVNNVCSKDRYNTNCSDCAN